jgi:hypothetical protein
MCIKLVLIKELYYDAWPTKAQDTTEVYISLYMKVVTVLHEIVLTECSIYS